MMDFDTDAAGNAIQAGQVIDEEYAAFGVHISVENYWKPFDVGIAFDSENPTGNDWDLGSGSYGYHPTNTVPLGNIMIIAEDIGDSNGDGYVDDPDDQWGQSGSSAGYIQFSFDTIQNSGSISLLDIDQGGHSIQFYLNGALLSSETLGVSNAGDNSYQVLLFSGFEFDMIQTLFQGPGGVASLSTNATPVPEPFMLPLVVCGAFALHRRCRRKHN